MNTDLKTLSKSEKFNQAEKHLKKYLFELKRHFGFSDLQLLKLLEISSSSFKRQYKDSCYSKILNLFSYKK